MTLDEANARVVVAKLKLNDALETLRLASIEASPVKIGEIYVLSKNIVFRWKPRRIEQRGQVTEFGTRNGRTRPVLTLFNADGNLGKRKVEMYDSKDWTKES
jgi:hypothetical protein